MVNKWLLSDLKSREFTLKRQIELKKEVIIDVLRAEKMSLFTLNIHIEKLNEFSFKLLENRRMQGMVKAKMKGGNDCE